MRSIKTFYSIFSFKLYQDKLIVNFKPWRFLLYSLSRLRIILEKDDFTCIGVLPNNLLLCQSHKPVDLVVLDLKGNIIKRVEGFNLYPNIYQGTSSIYFRGRKKKKAWFKLNLDSLEVNEVEDILNPRAFLINETAISWENKTLVGKKLHQQGTHQWELDVYKELSLGSFQPNEFQFLGLSSKTLLLVARHRKTIIKIRLNSGEIEDVLQETSMLNISADGSSLYFIDHKDDRLKLLSSESEEYFSLNFPSISSLEIPVPEYLNIRIHQHFIAIPSLISRLYFFDLNTNLKVDYFDLQTPPAKHLILPLYYKLFDKTAIIRYGIDVSAPLQILRIKE